MKQEQLEERIPGQIVIDYCDTRKRSGYIISSGGPDAFCGNDFNELFTRLSAECGFGFSREQEFLKYKLIIFDRAKPFLGEEGVELLEAVVNYHNHIVEKGNQNQRGQS